MNADLKKAAAMMGYRPMARANEPENAADCWGKPVGYGIMLISETDEHGIEWQQYFWHLGCRCGDGEEFRRHPPPCDGMDPHPICWNRKTYPVGGNRGLASAEKRDLADFLSWIKECENWEAKRAGYAGDSQGAFEFLTIGQSVTI